MIEVKDLVQTCEACPSQWEFRTFENRPVYARYRWGHLTVSIGPPNGDAYDAVGGFEIVSETLGDSYDGVLGWESVRERLYDLDQALLAHTLRRRENG